MAKPNGEENKKGLEEILLPGKMDTARTTTKKGWRVRVTTEAGYRRKFIQSIWLSLCFFALGVASAQKGPAFQDIQLITGTNVQEASSFLTAGAAGNIVGSLLSGVLYDLVSKSLLLLAAVLLAALTAAATPFCSAFWLMAAVCFLAGLCISTMATTGNAEMVRLWERKGRAAMQALHFSYALGAVLAPLLTEPFLAPAGPSLSSLNRSVGGLSFLDNQGLPRGPTLTEPVLAPSGPSLSNFSRSIGGLSPPEDNQGLPHGPTPTEAFLAPSGPSLSNLSRSKSNGGLSLLDEQGLPSTFSRSDGSVAVAHTNNGSTGGIGHKSNGSIGWTGHMTNGSTGETGYTINGSTGGTGHKSNDSGHFAFDADNPGSSPPLPETRIHFAFLISASLLVLSSVPLLVEYAKKKRRRRSQTPLPKADGALRVEHKDHGSREDMVSSILSKTGSSYRSLVSLGVVQNEADEMDGLAESREDVDMVRTKLTNDSLEVMINNGMKGEKDTEARTQASRPLYKPNLVNLSSSAGDKETHDDDEDVNTEKRATQPSLHPPNLTNLTSGDEETHDDHDKVKTEQKSTQPLHKPNLAANNSTKGIKITDPNVNLAKTSSEAGRQETNDYDNELGGVDDEEATRPRPRHRRPPSLPLCLHLAAVAWTCLLYLLMTAVEASFPSYLATYVVLQLQWGKSQGVLLTSVFFVAFAASRFAAIFLSKAMSSTQLLLVCLHVEVASMLTFTVASRWGVGWAVWVSTATGGAALSLLFPTGLTWLEGEAVPVTGRVVSAVMLAASAGAMLNPLVIGHLMEHKGTIWMAYVFLGEALLSLLTFILLSLFSRFYIQRKFSSMSKNGHGAGDVKATMLQ